MFVAACVRGLSLQLFSETLLAAQACPAPPPVEAGYADTEPEASLDDACLRLASALISGAADRRARGWDVFRDSLIASGLAQAGDLIDEFGVADRLDQVPPNI